MRERHETRPPRELRSLAAHRYLACTLNGCLDYLLARQFVSSPNLEQLLNSSINFRIELMRLKSPKEHEKFPHSTVWPHEIPMETRTACARETQRIKRASLRCRICPGPPMVDQRAFPSAAWSDKLAACTLRPWGNDFRPQRAALTSDLCACIIAARERSATLNFF